MSFSLTIGIFILICTEMPYQPFHCYIAWSYNNVPCPGNPGESTTEKISHILILNTISFILYQQLLGSVCGDDDNEEISDISLA